MSDKEPIDWDALDADTQHELVSLAEKLGEDEPDQEAKRTASRREFLGAVTAAGLGGSLLSQGADKAFEDFVNPASAGTQSVAQFGEAGEPFDFVAEDIYGPGGQGSGDPVNFEQIGSDTNRFTGYADTLDTSALDITTDVILSLGPSGGTIQSVDPDDFGDYGSAVNSAIEALPDYGDGGSNSHYGTVILPPANSIDYSTTIKVYKHTTIAGQGRTSTHLNYTGTGNALEDQRLSSGTDEFVLRDIRIDAPNGSFISFYQPNFCELQRVQSVGGNSASSVGIEVKTDTANAAANTFTNCRIKDYVNPFKHDDVNSNGYSLKRSTFYQPQFQTSESTGDIFVGRYQRVEWFSGTTEDANSTFVPDSGSNNLSIIGHSVDTDRGYGFDASNISGADVTIVGGQIKSLNDPNDTVTRLNTSGADNAQSVSVEEPNKVAGSRSVDTWYRNGTGSALIVMVTLSGSSGVDALIDLNDTQSNNQHGRISATDDGTSTTDRGIGTFIVPDGWYYKLRTGSGTVNKWVEHKIGR